MPSKIKSRFTQKLNQNNKCTILVMFQPNYWQLFIKYIQIQLLYQINNNSLSQFLNMIALFVCHYETSSGSGYLRHSSFCLKTFLTMKKFGSTHTTNKIFFFVCVKYFPKLPKNGMDQFSVTLFYFPYLQHQDKQLCSLKWSLLCIPSHGIHLTMVKFTL